MSSRTTLSEPTRSSVNRSVSSVFPTPVGPRKRKLALGRPGVVSLSSPCCSRSATRSIATSWPRTIAFKRAGSVWSRSRCAFVRSMGYLPFYWCGIGGRCADGPSWWGCRQCSAKSAALRFQALANLGHFGALPNEDRVLGLHLLLGFDHGCLHGA